MAGWVFEQYWYPAVVVAELGAKAMSVVAAQESSGSPAWAASGEPDQPTDAEATSVGRGRGAQRSVLPSRARAETEVLILAWGRCQLSASLCCTLFLIVLGSQ